MSHWQGLSNLHGLQVPRTPTIEEANQYMSKKKKKKRKDENANPLSHGPPEEASRSRKLQRLPSESEGIPPPSQTELTRSQSPLRETPINITTWLTNVEPLPPPEEESDTTGNELSFTLASNAGDSDTSLFFAADDSFYLPDLEQEAEHHVQTPEPPPEGDIQDEQAAIILEDDIEKLLYISSVSGDDDDESPVDLDNWEELFQTEPGDPGGPAAQSPSPLLSRSRTPLKDPTVENIHIPAPQTLSAFETALALWERRHNISRKGHRELVEVLRMAQSVDELRSIPVTKDTLKEKLTKSLPLLPLRRRNVSVDLSMMPSRTKSTEDVVTFDLRALLRAYLSSELNLDRIYRGMAKLIDGTVSEPWEARWWGESIRTTSGHCIRDAEGRPIWPSDFVYWTCNDSGREEPYLGRVTWCGLDFTSRSDYKGTPTLRVQDVISTQALPDDLLAAAYQARFSRDPSSGPNSNKSQDGLHREELIIILGDGHLIDPAQVTGRLEPIYLDYDFNPNPGGSSTHLEHQYTIRYVYDPTFSTDRFRPLMNTTPLRGEQEIAVFGRAYLEKMFSDTSMISLPFFLFSDAFGLFRNMYRSLMGLYLIPQFTESHIRNRRKSLIPLTLGPFGVELSDTLECLAHLIELDNGMYLDVGKERIFVCSFVAAIIGDMPNQQLLSGCMGPLATIPCRYCLIKQPQRHDLEFDIIKHGRYGEQLRRDIARCRQITMSAQRQRELTRLGIHGKWRITDTLESIFPSIDLIRSRPSDAAHSEYAGLAKFIFSLLFDDPGFFTARGLDSFTQIFNSFTFPPGWRRLQSPTRHLKSWRMQECARGIIVLPVILRIWLRSDFIKGPLRPALEQLGKDYFRESLFSHSTESFTCVEWMTAACWIFAKSVLRLCGPFSYAESIDEFHQEVVDGRRAVQFLIQACINAKRLQTGNRQESPSQQSNERAATPAFSEVFSDHLSVMPEGTRRGRATGKVHPLEAKKGLPNIHVGLHYREVAQEYGGCNMVFTLLGEDRHKMFKDDVRATNLHDSAATLIFRENFRLTVAFAFDGCFKLTNPQLHDTFDKIRQNCPILVAELESGADSEEKQMESVTHLRSDELHGTPLASCRLRYAKGSVDPLEFVGVTHIKNLAVNHPFIAALRKAYTEDYHVTAVTELGSAPLEWNQKFSFAVRSQERLCFTIGDFLKARGHFARIEGLFIHRRATASYLFAVVDFLSARCTGQTRELILETDIFELDGRREIIGLPEISHQRVWMVPRFDETFLFIDHDVYFI